MMPTQHSVHTLQCSTTHFVFASAVIALGVDWLILSWNKLRIWSVVRVRHPLVICEVSFRSLRGAERSKREKP